jgi:long-chain acyl-CoA synthetase
MESLPQFTVPVPGAVKKDGETLPRRHFKFADRLVDHPDNVTTMWDVFLHGNKISGGKEFVSIGSISHVLAH